MNRAAAALLWLPLFACITGRLFPERTRPTPPAIETLDFRPLRQMAENGRAVPAASRRCRPGRGPQLDPDDPSQLVETWRSTSELLHFVIVVVPGLFDVAERRPDQRSQRTRYVTAADLEIPGVRLGGFIKLRHRELRRELVRETLITSDLWSHDLKSGTVVYFDGRIDYGGSVLDGRPDAVARVNGWAEVHDREAGSHGRASGVDVKLKLSNHADGRVLARGKLDLACGGPIVLTAALDFERCPVTPGSVIESVLLERGSRQIALVQDEVPCDACLWWSKDAEAPPRRWCPEGW